MKMYSKILMVVLLAYFLDNLSAAILKSTTPTSLNGKNNPAQSKNILFPNPPIKNHFPTWGNIKVNPVVPLNIPAPPAPPSPPLVSTATLTPPVKLPASLASTRVPSAPLSPTFLQNLKKENINQQESKIVEEGDDNDEEEVEEEIEDEEPLENSENVTSTPIPSSSTSKLTVPDIVKQENDNRQGSDIGEEGDDYEEGNDYEEYEEESLENSKTVTSTPIPSSSTFKLTVPDIMKEENENRQGSDIGEEGDSYEEYYDDTVVENGHDNKKNLEDPNYSTPFIPTNNIINYGVRVNPPVTMNSPMTTEPQISEDELIENNYNDSEYSTNTNEDNQTYDDTQISTDKKEDNMEDQLYNQYASENKERIVNGYSVLKKILYMLHDYASLTFNWIINKINYQMEQLSVR